MASPSPSGGTLTLSSVSGGSASLEHLRDEPRRELRRGLEVELSPARAERDGERWDAEQRPLHRRRDRARVRDVVAEVRALVDARDDQRRARARRMPLIGEVHAVGGRAVDGEALRPELLDAQRPVQRERVAHRALLAIGRDDHHLAEGAERLGERRDALGVDAVVVGDQDERRGIHDGRAQGATKGRRLQAEGTDGRRAAKPLPSGRVGASRFERPTTRTPSECATWLRHAPAPGPAGSVPGGGFPRAPPGSQGDERRDSPRRRHPDGSLSAF